MLKVASYNIHKAVGTDRRRSPERIIDVLNEIDADVVALQEADQRFGSRDAILPERLLEMHSDYVTVPLSVRTESMGWHGNAILVKKSVEIVEHDIIHLPCIEPRGAVTALVRHEGLVVRLVGMHLDLSGLWRRRQAAAVLRHLALETLRPASANILMGDLNEWSQRGCIRDFGRALSFAPCGRSFHSGRPLAALDRIMWNGTLALGASGVHLSALSRRASDHLPIWAQFDIAGGPLDIGGSSAHPA
jgi:endonuclease/exonuclease/phosphatase family metal-dependent hydrolase